MWERQINTIRRVLDAMFTELGQSQLTHEFAGDTDGRSGSHCKRQADSSAAVRPDGNCRDCVALQPDVIFSS